MVRWRESRHIRLVYGRFPRETAPQIPVSMTEGSAGGFKNASLAYAVVQDPDVRLQLDPDPEWD